MRDPYRFTTGLGRAHLARSISILFDRNEDLLRFFFSHKDLVLRLPAKELIHDASDYPLPERLLIRVAIDFWNRRGTTRLSDLLNEWNSEQMVRFVQALCHLEEIEAYAREALAAENSEPRILPASSHSRVKG